MSAIPQTMKAIIVQKDKTVAVEQKPVPTLGPTDLLLKVISVGLNPTDWKHAAMISEVGAAIGCDFVGEVVQLGPEVPSGIARIGETRGAFMRGGKSPSRGAFAEYATQEYDLTFVVPKNLTLQQAASAPIPLFTATQAIYHRLGVPFADEDNSKVAGKWILIWSGSTSVGQYAIQIAKLAGLKVATTCSPRRNDLVKMLGADVIVDYKDPKVSEKLFEATNGEIELGLDTIAEGGSIQKAQLAFSKAGGNLVTILFDLSNLPRPEVHTRATLVYTALGADHDFGPTVFEKTSPEDRAQYVRSLKLATSLFEFGKLRPLAVTDLGGLEKIEEGFTMMKEAKNTTKLVHTLA